MTSKIALNVGMKVLIALQSLVILSSVIFTRKNFPGATLANATVSAKICNMSLSSTKREVWLGMWIDNVLPMEIYRHERMCAMRT